MSTIDPTGAQFPYASGDWRVAEGNIEEFVVRWREFITWTKREATGFVRAHLLHDTVDPQHFVSAAEWVSTADRDAWRKMQGFGEHFGACRELCDNVYASDYVRVAVIDQR